MQARIYKPAKSAMQSGGKAKQWILEYIRAEGAQTKDPVMGWNATTDMNQELKLKFSSAEHAMAYAKEHHITFELIQPHSRTMIKKQYSDNFTR